MASGTVYVDYRSKDEFGRVISFGRLLVGQNATITPRDVQMKTFRNISVTPWFAGPARFIPGSGQLRQVVLTSGSIGSAGVLDTSAGVGTSGNVTGAYARIRSYRLYGTGFGAGAGAGTLRLGTQAGSFRLSYMAAGE